MIAQHLTHLIEDLGLPPLGPKESNGYFQFPIQKDLIVSLRDLSPGIEITASLGPISTQKKEELLIHLMKANFLGQGTGNQIIGMNVDEKFLTLSRSITYEINYQDFKEILEEFTNYLVYWKGEVKRMQNLQPIL